MKDYKIDDPVFRSNGTAGTIVGIFTSNNEHNPEHYGTQSRRYREDSTAIVQYLMRDEDGQIKQIYRTERLYSSVEECVLAMLEQS